LSDYPHALRDFDKALEIDPFNADFFLARGDTKMHLQKFNEAIADYTSAIQLERNIASAYLNRGIAQHLVGENELAIKDVDKAIRLDYFNSEAWLKRGMIFAEMDSLTNALNDINHALSLKDKQPFALFQRALVNLKLGDTLSAIGDYNRVIELDENNALTYYNRALLFTFRKEYTMALMDYDEVIRINPYNVYTWYNRGNLHYQLDEFAEAEKDYSTAIDIFPDFAGAYINRSATRQSLGDNSGAQADRERAEAIIAAANGDGRDAAVLYSRYADSAYFNRIIEFEADFVDGNYEKGRVQFQRVAIHPRENMYLAYTLPLPDSIKQRQLKTTYTDAQVSAFNANNKLGIKLFFTSEVLIPDKATTLKELHRIDSLIMVTGDTVSALFIKGILYSMIKDYPDAINAYDEALEKDPKIAYAWLNRGTTRYEMDEFIYNEQQYSDMVTISSTTVAKTDQRKPLKPTHTKALKDYEEVLAQNPGLPFVYYNRANIKLSLQDFQRAIDDYSMAIKLEPNMAEAYYNRALTLLFLNEEGLACKDLSKAGELGITEAYNVIKRYCGK